MHQAVQGASGARSHGLGDGRSPAGDARELHGRAAVESQLARQPAGHHGGVGSPQRFAGQPGRSSFETRVEIRRQDDDVLYAEGRAKVVWVDHAAGKSIPLPDAMRRLIEEP